MMKEIWNICLRKIQRGSKFRPRERICGLQPVRPRAGMTKPFGAHISPPCATDAGLNDTGQTIYQVVSWSSFDTIPAFYSLSLTLEYECLLCELGHWIHVTWSSQGLLAKSLPSTLEKTSDLDFWGKLELWRLWEVPQMGWMPFFIMSWSWDILGREWKSWFVYAASPVKQMC